MLLVECLSREARVQMAQTFGEGVVLSALEAAREREAQAEADRARRLNALRLPEEGDARRERELVWLARIQGERAKGPLGSAV